MNIRRILAAKGIHYLVTRFGPQSLRRMAFDEKYRVGDWRFKNDSSGELPDLVRKYVRKGDLLMLGCGGAAVLEGLKQGDLTSALGVDLSDEAIRLANRYASESIRFKTGDMETFISDSHYDVILFSESLNYIPLANQEKLLQRLGNYLKKGGVFIVTFAQAKRYSAMIEGIRKHFQVREDRPFRGSSRHLLVFTPQRTCEKHS
jgi:2-polyprenyl-3-methyl-5-hydroxy-6-metoxy-1,4-benzoquinol methylase